MIRVETWDAPAGEAGFRVALEATEDEAEFPEVLVEEGADEAEEELRDLQEEGEGEDEQAEDADDAL